MRSAPASLLLHEGYGEPHYDLVIGWGKSCPTLKLRLSIRGFMGRWQAPHRRRYLSYRGPVGAGRGRVEQLWHGRVRWHRHQLGWLIHCGELGSIRVRADGLAE